MGFEPFDEENYRHMPFDKEEHCVKCAVKSCVKNLPRLEELVQLNTYTSHIEAEKQVATRLHDTQFRECPECEHFPDMDLPDEKIITKRMDDRLDQINNDIREHFGGDGHRSLEGYSRDAYAPHTWDTRKRLKDLGDPLPERRNKQAEKMYHDVIARMKKEGLI